MEPRDAPPAYPRAAPRACALPAVTERGGAGRSPAAPQEGAGTLRVRRGAAGDPARARGGARVAGAAGRPLVCPSVRPAGYGPAGSSPQPSLPGQACRRGTGRGTRGAARMKLVRKDLEKDNAGQVTLIPEEPEDMWHTYNLLQVGDSLRASTIRKVQTESSTGSVGSNRIRTTLTLCVETIDFDSQACQLRVKGTNIQENEYVKMGAYHTIELEPNRQFTLAKKQWDSVVLERIEQACDPAWSADVAAVVMQEGLAHVCLVTPSMTLTRAKVEVNIPRKRKGNCSQHDRALERFYEQVVQAIQRHINFEVVKCVLVASPGFVREQFCDYMFQQAVKTDNKLLLENRSKFLQVHSSSGHKYALKEALCDPAVTSRLSDTKAAGEVKALDDFYKMLQHEPDRAFYGLKHVEKANEAMAIDTLLISDELFRHQDVATRARYVKLVDSVRENMGTVRIFSSLHVSGEQLGQLTGVAAILRFPVAELSDQEDESSSEED
ncbi:protein pelota homolog [Passer montanus]|uniref:protein pelota homolog n=1 Tax=Passer montanus TaxID=9160 RepID=UPI00196138AD|nr:protein pelota homolog [Passer montanus]